MCPHGSSLSARIAARAARSATGTKILRRIDLRCDCGDNRLSDLVLHCKHVGKVAVVALRPKLPASRGTVELRGDAHAGAALAHAAVKEIADAELLADLLQGNGLALVGEG